MASQLFPNINKKDMQPWRLRGLKQAVFVSECLCRGETEDQITERFNGDKQLVDMWVSFARHNHWIEYDTNKARWSKTLKGERQAYDISLSRGGNLI
jgi:hypothetical protein